MLEDGFLGELLAGPEGQHGQRLKVYASRSAK
jgi:hypothetical protein